MRAVSDLRHDVVVLAIDGLLDEHWLVWLEGLDEKFRCLRTDRAMEIDSDIHLVPAGFSQRAKRLGRLLDEGSVLDNSGRALLIRSNLERGEALRHVVPDRVRRCAALVQPHSVPRRAPQHGVHRQPGRLPGDVPHRLLDAAQRAGQHRATAIERMSIKGLPVMLHPPRILAQQIRLHLANGLGAGLGPALDYGLT